MPIMQYHSEFNHHRTPVARPHAVEHRRADRRRPRVLRVFRRFAQLRERLRAVPACAGAAVGRDRQPLMRALFFEVADDPRIWDFPHQYYLGDDVLVAPVVEPGVEEWPVYLPRGEWVDAWTGQELIGPAVVTRPRRSTRSRSTSPAVMPSALLALFESGGALKHNALESMEVSS